MWGYHLPIVLRPANNMTITSGGNSYSPRNSVENDAWTLGESSEYGEYPDDYDENDEEHGDEDIDYVGQESDDVFETESGEAAVQGAQ
uniref:IP18111p n=1 Tax=Drosophila melanogaster TaxID=7227 RepID=A2VEP5_DROME|nr:IP18111p [Drosophila melanogaster]ABN49365.1 IP18211p [Drosophila melanogaster]